MADRGTSHTARKSFFDDLVAKRRLFIDGLDANEGEINLHIFEDFYPDHAHFVYELLQNAEDAGATRVSFTLTSDGLVCEHDGSRVFNEDDVTSITGIHNSTKTGEQERIGKFGVGFKSVFVYTQSPVIRSGEFSFRITKYILPEAIAADPALGSRTRFEFPFDNPKKAAAVAYGEIAPALRNLDETTLLFLSNLQSIQWDIGTDQGEVLRQKHADVHYEVRKQNGHQTTSGIHFLKFDQAVPGLATQRVAVAFPLEFLPGIRQFVAKQPLSQQFRIAPAAPGKVAVFFTAAKETSGLRFHLHAPFVPELSRASIKDTPANAPLFAQLATLSAASLHKIRDLDNTYRADFEQFVTLVETHPDKKALFADFYVFQGADGLWRTPGAMYLDAPYLGTDLSAYYGPLGAKAEHAALHPRYAAIGIAANRISAFAQAVGAHTALSVQQRGCSLNPDWPSLRSNAGSYSRHSVDRDYFIPHVADLLGTPSLELSRLVWRRLVSISATQLKATYSMKYHASADSSLVHELRAAAWIPQTDGSFVQPRNALVEVLPEGFSYDAAYEGLKAIQFGAEAARRSKQQEEKEDIAKTIGFADADAMERAKRIAELLSEDQQKALLAQLEQAANASTKAAVPDRIPANPRRHAEKTEEQAKTAPDKETEIRERSVSLKFETAKEQADQYLPLHYRNADGDMTCQICKGPVPFTLDDGSGFFEAVEFIPDLKKRHFQNYLALCPNHSAMYRHANGSKEIVRTMVEALPDNQANELDIVLARKDMTIYLSAVHVIDIKAVLRAEAGLDTE